MRDAKVIFGEANEKGFCLSMCVVVWVIYRKLRVINAKGRENKFNKE